MTPSARLPVFIAAWLLAGSSLATDAAPDTAAQPTSGPSIKVIVNNLKNTEGQVIVAVFDSKEDYLKKPVDEQTVPITDDLTGVAAFADLPPGQYAVVAYHDKNANRDLDTFALVPREAYGFSNGARGMFGPASFKSAAVELADEDLLVQIKAK